MAVTQVFQVLLLLLASWQSEGGRVANVTLHKPRELPCPESLAIMPCICTANADFTMDMDCSAVESEQQLSQIFNQHFDFVEFRKLLIEYNYNLNVLREGALGETSYEEIEIHNTGLDTVESGALVKSFTTARKLLFYSNTIAAFPFQEIENFVHLQELNLNNNNIFGFPYIKSTTLEYLHMSSNPIMDIPSTAFSSTTSLRTIGLAYAELSRVLPGMFLVIFGVDKIKLRFSFLISIKHKLFK